MSARIIVVDDQAGLRMLLEEVLKLEGYQVETAKNAQECLQKISSNRYDLIILDLILPGKSGFELIKKIKNYQSSDDIIIISGDENYVPKEKLNELGISEYIEKPFDLKIFKEKVNQKLSQ